MSPNPNVTDRLVIASSDSHVGPRLTQLRDYCESAYLEEFDAFAAACDEKPAQVSSDNDDSFDWDSFVTSAHYDVHERLRQLDADGVAAEVIFHGSQNGSPIPFWPTSRSFSAAGDELTDRRAQELCLVGTRMYNRWLADFCSVEPERHVGLAYLPYWNLDAAIVELEWARNAGLRGINFPAPRPSVPDYNDQVWDRFWSACEAHEMPLDTHCSGDMSIGPRLADYRGRGGLKIMLSEAMYFSSRGFMWLICGGVFERHPRLKLVLTEVRGVSAWLPTHLVEMDELDAYNNNSNPALASLPRRPSDYFRSNCFVGASFMSQAEARGAVSQGLVENYCWGSDFPHREGTYPWSKESLRMAMEGIEEGAIRRIAGQNMIDIFGLDAIQLQEVANRIGPTINEIMKPLSPSEIPVDSGRSPYTMAFRKGKIWT